MGKKILSSLLLVFCLTTLGAQDVESLVREKMTRLYPLAGEWRGEGEITLRDGRPAAFQIVEKADVRLGGTILVVEGVGTRAGAPTDTVHFAYGVLTYNPWARQYNVRAYKSDGLFTDAAATFRDDGAFEWRIENPYVGIIRNVLTLTEDTWREIGDQSRDEGKTWTKFFEMRLHRVKN